MKKRTGTRVWLLCVLLCFVGGVALPGCGGGGEGSDRIDEAVEEIQDEAEDARDELDEAKEELEDEIDDRT